MRSTKFFASSALLALLLLAVGSPPGFAPAATTCDRVASPTGSDSASGTLENPYRSAGKLAGSLAPGQTGCFLGGTYSFSSLSLSTAAITLRPYGSEAVTLAGHIKVYPGASNTVIEGMKLDASSSSTDDAGPKIYADGVVLRDNEITNRNTEICVIVGSYYDNGPPTGVVIERNRIHHCGALPATNLDHGIYLSEARNPVVRDNWIYENADRGVQQYPDVKGAQITGNVIAGNGQGVNFSGSGSLVTTDATVAGNIVVDSKIGANAYSGGSGPDGTNNFFRDNCVRALSGESGIESDPRSFTPVDNLIASPAFVNAGAGDYRLQSTSPCLAKYTGTMSLPEAAPAQHTVTVQTSGSGTVTSIGISCPGDCSEAYAAGTPVSLTATPASGSSFTGWSGACSGAAPCEVTVDADKSVTATFASASPAMGGTSLLRPDTDIEVGWKVHGATSAWSALDEEITKSTKAGATDYIRPTRAGQTTTVGFTTRALDGAVPKAATLWYYGKSLKNTQLQVELRSGGQTRATHTLPVGSRYAWRSLTAVPADQAGVDDLNVRVTSIGSYDAAVRAAYIQLDT